MLVQPTYSDVGYNSEIAPVEGQVSDLREPIDKMASDSGFVEHTYEDITTDSTKTTIVRIASEGDDITSQDTTVSKVRKFTKAEVRKIRHFQEALQSGDTQNLEELRNDPLFNEFCRVRLGKNGPNL